MPPTFIAPRGISTTSTQTTSTSSLRSITTTMQEKTSSAIRSLSPRYIYSGLGSNSNHDSSEERKKKLKIVVPIVVAILLFALSILSWRRYRRSKSKEQMYKPSKDMSRSRSPMLRERSDRPSTTSSSLAEPRRPEAAYRGSMEDFVGSQVGEHDTVREQHESTQFRRALAEGSLPSQQQQQPAVVEARGQQIVSMLNVDGPSVRAQRWDDAPNRPPTPPPAYSKD